MRVIVDELTRAKNAVEWLCMDLPDALDCAELMVRQCVISAVGVGPGDRQPRVMFPPASPRDLARSRTSGDGRFR
jgi:hypothetical protein